MVRIWGEKSSKEEGEARAGWGGRWAGRGPQRGRGGRQRISTRILGPGGGCSAKGSGTRLVAGLEEDGEPALGGGPVGDCQHCAVSSPWEQMSDVMGTGSPWLWSRPTREPT